ncbi:MAG TPA: galactosyltransferase-related protein [Pirellulales bacterium]|jgi:glycosyltransferase involved in cell wall biosynthesis|nr:galactosyltransferase-related protein [Pirellulales bacterium]
MPDIEIAISVTTYQKPWHLRRALASIAGQRGVEGKIEVVVTDDGSTDETSQIVAQFRREVDFPVYFTTHEHAAFQVSRCRNEGAQATTAPYLLFVDGDCVLPADHVAIHLARRRPGRAMLGDCYRIEREISETLTEDGARHGEFLAWHVNGERERHARQHRKARLYGFLRHSRKPKLVGNNFGVWRGDFERVNGFDENFCGWGQEDDDLGLRLRRAGVRLDSVLDRTRSYHLWHPRDPTTTTAWREGTNVPYFLRRGQLTRCRNGLVKRSIADLAIQVIGTPADLEHAAQLCGGAGLRLPNDALGSAATLARTEVEILLLPGDGRFSGRAEFQMLVLLDEVMPSARLLGQANLIVSDRTLAGINGTPQFAINDFTSALDAIA